MPEMHNLHTEHFGLVRFQKNKFQVVKMQIAFKSRIKIHLVGSKWVQNASDLFRVCVCVCWRHSYKKTDDLHKRMWFSWSIYCTIKIDRTKWNVKCSHLFS